MNEITQDDLTIAITIQHPAHVHFFKHIISELNLMGHDVHVFVRESDVNISLLDFYDIPYIKLANEPRSSVDLFKTQLTYEYNLLKEARKISPDIFIAEAGVAAAHISALVGAEYQLFINNEHATLENHLSMPFASDIYVPSCFYSNPRFSVTRYNSYYPLAYTHPDWFQPSPAVFDHIPIDREEPFAILRLVSWNAAHDVGQNGIKDVKYLISKLEESGIRVLISSEGALPSSLKSYQMSIPPHRLHDLLYYADIYVGEGGMTAAESALLGTPSVFINSIDLGYLNELENRYELVTQISPDVNSDTIARTIIKLLTENKESVWSKRRRRILDEKEDMTALALSHIIGND